MSPLVGAVALVVVLGHVQILVKVFVVDVTMAVHLVLEPAWDHALHVWEHAMVHV